LRKDMRLGGAYYEVSHDTLIKPIVESYTLRKAKERKISERKRIVRVLMLLGITAALAIGAFLFAAWALRQRDNALKAENQTQEVLIQVEKAKEKAIDEKNRADSLLLIAEREKNIALTQKQRADSLLLIANKERRKTSKALNQKDLKEKERQKEEQKRKTVEIQRIIEKAKGYKLNGDCDIALEELNKALKINNNSQIVKQLIKECQDEINNK